MVLQLRCAQRVVRVCPGLAPCRDSSGVTSWHRRCPCAAPYLHIAGPHLQADLRESFHVNNNYCKTFGTASHPSDRTFFRSWRMRMDWSSVVGVGADVVFGPPWHP